jgi:hypothetical protein
MKTLLIAVALMGLGGAGSAADAPRDRQPSCPAKATGEAYGPRARDYCEVRWTSVLAARETGSQTHDEFIDTCLRRCVTARGATAGAPLGWILGGVGAAALAGGVAAGSGGGGSHAPPASP